MVPRSSDRISRVPPYLIRPIVLRIRGCHPLWPTFPGRSAHTHGSAGPRSLAATGGVSVDFLSSGYLDVSVPRVRSLKPMYSVSKYLFLPAVSRHATTTRRPAKLVTGQGPARSVRYCEAITTNNQVGCPIRTSMDQGLFTAPHGLSQCTTSFIASCCQGIHQTPFSRLIRSGKSKDGVFGALPLALFERVIACATAALPERDNAPHPR